MAPEAAAMGPEGAFATAGQRSESIAAEDVRMIWVLIAVPLELDVTTA